MTNWQNAWRLPPMNSPAEKFEEGCRLFDEGEYFEAHEVWEDLWNEAEGPRRHYLQGLIQVAAALVHAGRENWNGTRKLFGSALLYLEKGAGGAEPGEVDVAALRDAVGGFELALREKLEGKPVELPFFTLPRLP